MSINVYRQDCNMRSSTKHLLFFLLKISVLHTFPKQVSAWGFVHLTPYWVFAPGPNWLTSVPQDTFLIASIHPPKLPSRWRHWFAPAFSTPAFLALPMSVRPSLRWSLTLNGSEIWEKFILSFSTRRRSIESYLGETKRPISFIALYCATTTITRAAEVVRNTDRDPQQKKSRRFRADSRDCPLNIETKARTVIVNWT